MKHKASKGKSYEHLQGSPMDPGQHPATQMPDATVPMWGNQLTPGSELSPDMPSV